MQLLMAVWRLKSAVEYALSRLLCSSIKQAVCSFAISICWFRDCPHWRTGDGGKAALLSCRLVV
jgi:hypothetical protein